MTVYLLAGGGTAGHVNPLLAIADTLRERQPTAEVLVLGTAEGLESRLVPDRGYELLTIERLPFPRRPNRAALSFPRRFRAAVERVREIIRERGVEVVVGVGGYASAPAYVAAHREGIPFAVHEANARPGFANRLGSWLTSFVGVTFEGTRLRHASVVGMPLRREIERLDKFAARAQALEFFDLSADAPVLLVTGGSSGARRLNETVRDRVPSILGAGWQIVHITGEYRDEVDDPGLPGYHVVKYCDRMDLALAVATLVVARAGSSTVAELMALGIPSVLIPYPVGNGEQRLNARTAVDSGGALLVADRDFTPEWMDAEFVPLLLDRAAIAAMAARMATVGVKDGAARMADLIGRAVARR